MKKILVPVDFSKEAKYACKVAATIAKKTKSEIILLHMLDIPSKIIDPLNSNGMRGGAQSIAYMKAIHRKFEKYKALPFFKGIKLTEDVKFHKAFEGVIQESKKHKVDLIIMGSQGATGLKEMIVGSNTEKVVRSSDIPVLVIKHDVENFAIKNILFASDFSAKSKKNFKKVINFAKLFNAKINLLFVNTIHNFETSRESQKKLNAFVKNLDFKHSINICNDKTVEEGILNYGRENNSDIIAINTHGRSGLSQLFNESISKELANHALRPVITFKI